LLSRLHASELPGFVELRGEDMGLSMSRVSFRYRWSCLEWAGRKSLGKCRPCHEAGYLTTSLGHSRIKPLFPAGAPLLLYIFPETHKDPPGVSELTRWVVLTLAGMRFPALTPEQLAPKSTALHSGHWLIALKDYGISALQKSSPERRPRDYAARILATLNRTHARRATS
jgi:hypothetical protein